MGFTSDYARWKREGEEKGREEGFADGLEKGKGMLMALRRVKAIQSRLFLGKEL